MLEDYHNLNDYWMQHPQSGEQLDPDEAFKAGCFGAFFYIAALVVGILICLLFGSCKSVEYVFVPQTHTDTLIVIKIQHDSIYINDSTVITEKGDTVTIEKWHTKYIERETHDTIFQHSIDSIPKPYPVEKRVEVEKHLSWWQKTTMYAGDVMLLLLLGLLIYGATKLIHTLRR